MGSETCFKIMLGFEFRCTCKNIIEIPFLRSFSFSGDQTTWKSKCRQCNRIYKAVFSFLKPCPGSLEQWSKDFFERLKLLSDEAVRFADLYPCEITLDAE